MKTTDTRTKAYVRETGLRYGVELEAMDTVTLRDRVETAIVENITDLVAWSRVRPPRPLCVRAGKRAVDAWTAPDSIQGLGHG